MESLATSGKSRRFSAYLALRYVGSKQEGMPSIPQGRDYLRVALSLGGGFAQVLFPRGVCLSLLFKVTGVNSGDNRIDNA